MSIYDFSKSTIDELERSISDLEKKNEKLEVLALRVASWAKEFIADSIEKENKDEILMNLRKAIQETYEYLQKKNG